MSEFNVLLCYKFEVLVVFGIQFGPDVETNSLLMSFKLPRKKQTSSLVIDLRETICNKYPRKPQKNKQVAVWIDATIPWTFFLSSTKVLLTSIVQQLCSRQGINFGK